MSIHYHKPGARMSQFTVHNGTLYLAGQVAADASADMAGQTQQILQQIDALLAEGGSDKAQLLAATIWVTDMADFDAMNAAWDAWVAPGRPPVRACVEAKLAKPDWRVEIMVTAAVKE